MRLINPNLVTYIGTIADSDLKDRLVREALEQAGCLGPDGKPLKGVTTRIERDGRQGSGQWTVTITRDLTAAPLPALLTGPEAK